VDITTLKLRGMSCAACANSIEDAIRSVPGVSECSVNFGVEQASVTYDPQQTDLETIQDAVTAAGYSAQPIQEQDLLTGDDDAERTTRRAT
jgi:P-type Cu+ transporter